MTDGPIRSGHETPDVELLDRAREGARLAFGLLYLRHHAAAWRIARIASGFSDDAEVALIDGFTATFSALPAYGPTPDFRRCLVTGVRRVALDRLLPRPTVVSLDDTPPGPVYGYGRCDADVVREALRSLPEVFRTALWLHEVEAWTPVEIADALNLGSGRLGALLAESRGFLEERRIDGRRLRGVAAAVVGATPSLGGECQRRWLLERAMHRSMLAAGPGAECPPGREGSSRMRAGLAGGARRA